MKSILLMAALGVPVICLAGNPVKLAPFEPFETAQLDVGERAFSDREFTFLEMPEALKGMTFRRGLFDGGEVEVVAEGELTVISPAKKTSHVSQEQALAAAGFVRDESVPVFQAWGKWSCDKASVWRKHVKAGEKLAFGKWAIVCGFSAANQRSVIRSARNRALEKRLRPQYTESELRDILVTQPDFAVFIPPEPGKRHQRVAAGMHDTYNDHFQVINDEKRGRLYAFWTQATREPMADHHTAFRMSKDGGVTWSPLTVLAGRMDTNTTDLVARPNASWQQPMLAKSGRLYCFWSRGYDHRMCGRYSDDGGKTWSEPDVVPIDLRTPREKAENRGRPDWWCNWQRPLRLGRDGRFFVGCSRHGKAPYDPKWTCKIEFWEFLNIDENPPVGEIRFDQFATNRDMLSPAKVEPVPGVTPFEPKEEPAVEEAAVVKLPDGRLFALMRSSLGWPVWSQSRDSGRTWSGLKALLDAEGKPIPHPRSPCPLYDWKGLEAGSGKYFALVHMKFDFTAKTAYQTRGPLYLIAGEYDPTGDQPIRFAAPKLFAPRKGGNSFYTSYCVVDGKGVLWYNDMKFYLCGRVVGPEWFD